jgi:hypothetical protein
MTKVVKKTVTFEAELYDGKNEQAIKDLLENTDVKFRDGYLRFPPPPYETHGYVENGPSRVLWANEHWVVVSSIGEVRRLTLDEFSEEFAEEWEGAVSSEQKIELLRGQLGVMAGWVMDLLERADAYVTPSEWGTLEQIKKNNS